jgi:hypothetical protein
MTIKIDGNKKKNITINNRIKLSNNYYNTNNKIIKFSFNTSTQIYMNNEIIKFNYLKIFISTSPILETTHNFHTYKY